MYLVTGGAGFIGSNIVRRLLTAGKPVVILDNFNDYYDPAIKWRNVMSLGEHSNLTVIEGDVRDAELLNRIFESYAITHVVHMAAMAGVRSSVFETPLYMAVNLTGTMNLLEAARRHDVQQVVMASTSSVYGQTPNIPFEETDAADRPLASYPASKRAAEILAHTYYNLFELNITILRFFNVYGPAGRPDMMPLRLMNAALDGAVIKLFNDGDVKRDWTYIDDTVDGVIAALERPLGYEIINLGFGSPIGLNAFVGIIEELADRKINTVSTEMPASDPLITYCNNEKAQRLLDFHPKVDIEEGLRLTWEWFSETNAVDAKQDQFAVEELA
jgi:UDP-glucuronate 4-epimerase